MRRLAFSVNFCVDPFVKKLACHCSLYVLFQLHPYPYDVTISLILVQSQVLINLLRKVKTASRK
jgi:hypothetical protein